MTPLLPDFFTAYGMACLSAFTVVWVMWALGRQYWQQGMALTLASTLLSALAYGLLALHTRWNLIALLVVSQALLSMAIGVFTVAIQRFRQSSDRGRDATTVLLPTGVSLLLAAWLLPQDLTRFHQLHAAMVALQLVFAVVVLLRIRTSTPGRGWILVTGAVLVHMLAILPVELFRTTALFDDAASTSPANTLLLWVLCLGVLLQLSVRSIGFLIMLRDRETVMEQSKAQLDPLTQLPNRAALVQILQHAIEAAAQQGQALSIMVLDIDHFKSVNDSYGHLVGDYVIQSIARTVMQHRRTSDFAARYGGEEFVVVLPNTHAREAFHLAERLCQAVRKSPMPLPNGKLLHTTISVGVYAGTPTHGSSWERLVGAADEAMYVAKRNGRDRVAMSATVHTMQSHTAAAMP